MRSSIYCKCEKLPVYSSQVKSYKNQPISTVRCFYPYIKIATNFSAKAVIPNHSYEEVFKNFGP